MTAAAAGEGIIAMRTMNKDKEEMINVVKVCIVFPDLCITRSDFMLYFYNITHLSIKDYLAVCKKLRSLHRNSKLIESCCQ